MFGVQTNFEKMFDLTDIPVVDGHMWLVRNGRIIDPHFREYDYIAKTRGVSSKINHLPAPKEVQEEVIENYTQYFNNISLKNWKNMNGCAPVNAINLQRKLGGDLVFGSLGFGEGKKIWWEYGGEKWDRIEYFLKMIPPPQEEEEKSSEEEKISCCVCLEEFSKMSFVCKTCNEGRVCKKCCKRLKGVRSCPVCRT